MGIYINIYPHIKIWGYIKDYTYIFSQNFILLYIDKKFKIGKKSSFSLLVIENGLMYI